MKPLPLSVVLAEDVDFDTWLEYGRARGWCSEPVCSTHDGVPSTPEEADEWEAGGDPCEHVLRLWP